MELQQLGRRWWCASASSVVDGECPATSNSNLRAERISIGVKGRLDGSPIKKRRLRRMDAPVSIRFVLYYTDDEAGQIVLAGAAYRPGNFGPSRRRSGAQPFRTAAGGLFRK